MWRRHGTHNGKSKNLQCGENDGRRSDRSKEHESAEVGRRRDRGAEGKVEEAGRKKVNERKKRERNTKAVLDILREEKLDLISSDVWRKSLPQLRKLLGQESEVGSPTN